VAQWLTVFGRVPFFYYLLHIPLITPWPDRVADPDRERGPVAIQQSPMNPGPAPAGYMWSLGLLYLVWAIAVVMLYFPSRWYADLKARRTDLRWPQVPLNLPTSTNLAFLTGAGRVRIHRLRHVPLGRSGAFATASAPSCTICATRARSG